MTTASRLVLARRRRGLTVTRLAQLAGLTARRLSDFENGRAHPSPPSLTAIAEALEFPEPFFSAEEVADLPAESVSFRALSKMTASQRDTALSGGRLARLLQDWIAARFRLPAPDLPSLTSFSRWDEGNRFRSRERLEAKTARLNAPQNSSERDGAWASLPSPTWFICWKPTGCECSRYRETAQRSMRSPSGTGAFRSSS
ncbi:helix-turn-helix domain-containing protein [Streptomyces melanosporofaciens]|uniref:helix-turn-helix domain-containing protein n=1 Tax=Streptomyces melanosporofaciens TaxID=67327 RepID=UPI001AD7E7CE